MNRTTTFLKCIISLAFSFICGAAYSEDNGSKAICIDKGRQLFVDEYLIEKTDLERIAHRAKKIGKIMEAETELEMGRGVSNPGTILNDGGVWWDPKDGIFKMVYQAGWLHTLAYAESQNGIDWFRPELDIEPGTNRILTDITPDSSTMWLDHDETDPQQRFKMFVRPPIKHPAHEGEILNGWCMTSPDGIHWNNRVKTGICGDRSTIFYNPFSSKWIFSIRSYGWLGGGREDILIGRYRRIMETEKFMENTDWERGEPEFWMGAENCEPDPYIGDRPELYNFSAVPYESIMIGIRQILVGPNNEKCSRTGAPKVTDLMITYSRDGYEWDFTDSKAFIPASRYEGAWDRGYLSPSGSICGIVGDKLWFWYSGYEGRPENKPETPGKKHGFAAPLLGMYNNGAIGLAVLRRDGFVSYSARETQGELLTKPLCFSGKNMFVNVDCPEGELLVEILDAETMKPIPGFSFDRCVPVTDDKTLTEIRWKGQKDLRALVGKSIRFRFRLTAGDLYAFWVSPDNKGASHGYNAAGGPGFEGGTDTVGKEGYRKAASYTLPSHN